MAMPKKQELVFFSLIPFYTTIEAGTPKLTRIQFYMHDIVGGTNATTIRVVGRLSNYTGSDPTTSTFGAVSVMDNPLTTTPDKNSALMGYTQGMYTMASQQDEFGLLMTMTYSITSGRFKGSSLSVVSQNLVLNEVREMPVVEGTGVFRLARGYCLARTYSMDQLDTMIGYNVTLLHY